MNRAEMVHAIRTSVAVSEYRHVVPVTVSGPGAFDLVERVCSRELFIRDGQIMQALLLDPQGRVWADVEICRDDETLHILADGVTPDALVAYLHEHRPAGVDAEVRDRSQSDRILALDGAYAWELLADLAGPEVIGLPYLSLFEGDGWTCFRAGKTGEFGYYLLTPAERADGLRSRLLELARRFDRDDPADADDALAALDQCQLENGFLCMRARGIGEYNPIELQQQWRVSYRKQYVGATALLQAREAGVPRRTVHVVGAAELRPGATVHTDGRAVGTLLHCGYSAPREQWVGLAMVESGLAHPGLRGVLRADSGAGDERIALDTISAPVLNNRSLYINPQTHSYFTRTEQEFPPLVMDATWASSLTAR